MKHIMLALFLIGCVSNISAPVAVENPKPTPIQISLGFDYPISWTCEQKEVNDSLVWIECEFTTDYRTDITLTRELQEERLLRSFGTKCIEVSYYNNNDGNKLVVSGNNRMCVEPFYTGQKKIKYVSFTSERRAALADKCGPMLESCTMLSQSVYAYK